MCSWEDSCFLSEHNFTVKKDRWRRPDEISNEEKLDGLHLKKTNVHNDILETESFNAVYEIYEYLFPLEGNIIFWCWLAQYNSVMDKIED